ncbi:hypothetical protein D3C81_1284940 [compost metagenome]
MAGVDQFFVDRRGIGQDPEPAERIDPFEDFQAVGGNRLSRHSMEAVATGDVVAIETIPFAVFLKSDKRFVGFHAVGNDVVGLINRLRASLPTSGHQVAGDFGLAVDHHGLATRQGVQIDVYLASVEGQFEAAMHQSLGVHALTHAGLTQQLYHALFKHAGADSTEYIVRGLTFENEGVDSGIVQQLAEQQARRAGANDGDLGFQRFHCSYDSQASRDQGR